MSAYFDEQVGDFLEAAMRHLPDHLKAAALCMQTDIASRIESRAACLDLIQLAREQVTEELEIDEYPEVSEADDGVWVQAWVWVPRPWYLNRYACPECGNQWEDEWTAQSDDDCGSCGARNISPYESEEL